MKYVKWTLIIVLLTGLAFSLAACGGDAQPMTPPEKPTIVSQAEPITAPTNTPQPTDTPRPTATPEPTASPEPTDTPEAETGSEDSGLMLDDLAKPADLSSYRSTMHIFVEGLENGEEIQGTIEFLIEYTRDPLAQRVVISGEGFDDSEMPGSIEMYQVEDTAYMKFGDEWISIPVTEDDPLGGIGMMGPDEALNDTCGWKKEKDTEYNGIKVQHWTLGKQDLEKCMTSEQLAEIGEITEASGDLYVAVDDNYVAAMKLIFEGKNLKAGIGTEEGTVDEGRMELTFEMLDVDQPFTIEVPEEALASDDLPEDIPIPQDAEEIDNTFGMLSFYAPGTSEEVAEFYQDEMPKNGWTQVSADTLGSMQMLEYSKENRTASIMISTDDAGKTSVLISIQEDEN